MESAYQRNLKTEEMAFSGVKEFPLGLWHLHYWKTITLFLNPCPSLLSSKHLGS